MKKALAVILLFMTLFLTVNQNAYAADKTYSCDGLSVTIRLQDNGDALIKENWTMSYKNGEFTKFTRNIPLDNNYSIVNFTVSDSENGDYKKLDGFDSSKPKNCYAVENSNDELKTEIYYRAKDESKTFIMSYELKNAVTLYNDTAEFYWKIVGDGWDIPIRNIDVQIILPDGSVKDQIRAWGHGPLEGVVTIEGDNLVTLKLDYLKSNTYIEARILTPTNIFKNSINKINKDKLNDILTEEKEYADKANRTREAMRFSLLRDLVLPLLLLVGGAIILIRSCKKFGKRFTPSFAPEYYRDIENTKLTPSEVIDLMNFYNTKIGDNCKFTSTLLDLNLKGVISILPEDDDNRKKNNLVIKILKENTNGLKPHEIEMMYFLKSVKLKYEIISQKNIKKYINKYSDKVYKTFNEFKNKSRKELDDNNFIDTSIKAYYKYFVISIIACISLSIFSFVILKYSFGIVFIILLIISIICLASMKRLSQSGEDELALWMGYQRFVKEFTSFKEKQIPDLILWEKYLVYAVALGLGKEILKELPIMYPDMANEMNRNNSRFVNLYLFYSVNDSSGGIDTLKVNNSIFKSFESIGGNISGAFSSSSSASGSGGGFSTGGGGGGGGGGGSCS